MVYTTNQGVKTRCRKTLSTLSRDQKQQLTVFQCFVEIGNLLGPIQLILPCPKGAKIVSMEHYPLIFKDLGCMYPDVSNMPLDHPLVCPSSNHPDSVSVEKIEDPTLKQIYDTDFECIVIRISKSGQISPIAYSHPARPDKRLFVPTRIKDIPGGQDPKWDNAIYTINTTSSGGESCVPTILNSAFRWDLIPEFSFPSLENIRRILTNVYQPNHNLYMATLSTDLLQNPYIGPDGTIFIDNTNLRVVQFRSYGFKTLPIVNGCFLTQKGEHRPYYFGGTKCIFDEEKGRIKLTDDVDTPLETVYYIYPSKIKQHSGQYFLEYD